MAYDLFVRIDEPLSHNNAYENRRAGGRCLSAAGRAYKNDVMRCVLAVRDAQEWAYPSPKTDWFVLELTVYYGANRKDLGNCEKLVTDAVAEILRFNDNRAVRIFLTKKFDKKNPRAYYTVTVCSSLDACYMVKQDTRHNPSSMVY